jgi:hypothetical protein
MSVVGHGTTMTATETVNGVRHPSDLYWHFHETVEVCAKFEWHTTPGKFLIHFPNMSTVHMPQRFMPQSCQKCAQLPCRGCLLQWRPH